MFSCAVYYAYSHHTNGFLLGYFTCLPYIHCLACLLQSQHRIALSAVTEAQ